MVNILLNTIFPEGEKTEYPIRGELSFKENVTI
jgi:hypothetical protein